jgi:hypothetical protein
VDALQHGQPSTRGMRAHQGHSRLAWCPVNLSCTVHLALCVVDLFCGDAEGGVSAVCTQVAPRI